MTTQLSVERKKMLNKRISRGKRAPLIFQACAEVAAKEIFQISLLVWDLRNTETILKKKRPPHVSIVHI